MKFLENRIPPPVLLMVTAISMWLLSRHSAPLFSDGAWRTILVVFLSGFGLVTGAPAIRAFRRAKTTINPVDITEASTLVTAGIFGFSRNPMYVSLSVLLAAWAVQLNNVPAFVGTIFFVVFVTRFQIIPEERFLALRFGQAYLSYRAKVRRWL